MSNILLFGECNSKISFFNITSDDIDNKNRLSVTFSYENNGYNSASEKLSPMINGVISDTSNFLYTC